MRNSKIIQITALIGMLGVFLVTLGDIIGMLVYDKHNPIADTVSMLAEGPYSWIQDVGIHALAVGILSLAVGLYVIPVQKKVRWNAGLFFLLVMAVVLVIIADGNSFADPQKQKHMYLVYILAGAFLLSTVLLSQGLKRLHPDLKKLSLWAAGLWALLSPFFFLVPNAYDGAYERLILVVILGWITVVSYRLYKFGVAEVRSRNLSAS